MSGHSKWSTIKHQKGAADAKRGAMFTKLSRDIALAVRDGGGPDPEMNFRLRLAIEKAKSNNMPQDNITRSIKRSSGEGGGEERLEEVIYEGYGPGGGAILLQALTTNRKPNCGRRSLHFQSRRWEFGGKRVRRLELRDQGTYYDGSGGRGQERRDKSAGHRRRGR